MEPDQETPTERIRFFVSTGPTLDAEAVVQLLKAAHQATFEDGFDTARPENEVTGPEVEL